MGLCRFEVCRSVFLLPVFRTECPPHYPNPFLDDLFQIAFVLFSKVSSPADTDICQGANNSRANEHLLIIRSSQFPRAVKTGVGFFYDGIFVFFQLRLLSKTTPKYSYVLTLSMSTLLMTTELDCSLFFFFFFLLKSVIISFVFSTFSSRKISLHH